MEACTNAPYKIAPPNVSVLNVLNWLRHDINTQANVPNNTPTRHQATAVAQKWLDQDSKAAGNGVSCLQSLHPCEPM